MDAFSGGFVSILAASQTVDSKGWYQGTADAVRKNMVNFSKAGDNVLLLSGDHLYRMDFDNFIDFHNARGADITLAVVRRAFKGQGIGNHENGSDFRVTDL